MSSIDWHVTFYASRGSVTLTKAQCDMEDENTYIARVDTSRTGTGKLCGILYPGIPDSGVEGGVYRPPVPFDTGEIVVSPYYLSDGMRDC